MNDIMNENPRVAAWVIDTGATEFKPYEFSAWLHLKLSEAVSAGEEESGVFAWNDDGQKTPHISDHCLFTKWLFNEAEKTLQTEETCSVYSEN